MPGASAALAEEIQQDAPADRVAVAAASGSEDGPRNLWIEHLPGAKAARLRPGQAAAIKRLFYSMADCRTVVRSAGLLASSPLVS